MVMVGINKQSRLVGHVELVVLIIHSKNIINQSNIPNIRDNKNV